MGGKVTIIIENSSVSSSELETRMHTCFTKLEEQGDFYPGDSVEPKDGIVYIVPDED